MILLRVLLLGALIWLIWAIWRRITGRDQAKAPEQVENMVKCAECGQHVPESAAIKVRDAYFCHEHRPNPDA